MQNEAKDQGLEGFSDSRERAGEYFRLALRSLGQYGLDPTPVNYAVLFGYHSGQCRNLRTSLDQYLKAGRTLTDEACLDLFRKYLYDCDEYLMEVYREDLIQVVAQTLGNLTDFIGETHSASETFERHASRLAAAKGLKEVLETVAALVADTRNLAHRTRSLETDLATSVREVQTLRKELSSAKEEAQTDGLTGLLNRRAFWTTLEANTEGLSRRVPIVCMLVIDVDYFKEVNDNYGHIAGDKVLRAVADMLVKTVKGRDRVGRVGGEEFAILLPDTMLTGARSVAEDLRKRIARKGFILRESSETVSITISIGIACYHKGESAEAFFQRCDQALYKAKQQGRNQVEMAQ
jgi:diguanylate cyclase